MHEAAIHAYVKASPVGLALGLDWQQKGSMLGDAMAGVFPTEGMLPTFTLLSVLPAGK